MAGKMDWGKVKAITINGKGASFVFRKDSDSAPGKAREMETRNAFARVFMELLSMDSGSFLKCGWNAHKFDEQVKASLGPIRISPEDIYNFSQEMAGPQAFQAHLPEPLKKDDFNSRANRFFGALINICGEPCRVSYHVTPGAHAKVDIIQEVYVPRTKDVGCRAGQHPR